MTLRLATFGLAALFATFAVAQQDDAVSAWGASSHSSVRLIAGGRNADGAYRIGVEIRMNEGFKTYWRVPGDAGVPPVFDWTASENVGSVSVRWPAPARYVEDGLTTIGYRDRVIFPALIRPADGGKPTQAALKIDYAVCNKICIPAKAEVVLKLPDSTETSQTAALDQFRALTPRPKDAGKLDDKLGLVAARFLPENGRKTVELIISVPTGTVMRDAFLEGPEGWLFGTPVSQATEGDKLTLRVPVEDKPKNVVGLVPVVLTIAGMPLSAEVRFDLDIMAPKP